MPEYLSEDYGIKEQRRERIIRWTILSVLILVLVVGLTYFAYRSYPAEKQINLFLKELRDKNYQAAYRLWGCTENSPCRDYTLDKFLQDWGPNSQYANASAAVIQKRSYCGPGGIWSKLGDSLAHALGERVCYCGPGMIATVNFGVGNPVYLWYQRSDGTLGFAPGRFCLPQPKAFE
jgi:hypothetical protein